MEVDGGNGIAGLPSAIAARLVRPRQAVVAVVGDGGFLMNSQVRPLLRPPEPSSPFSRAPSFRVYTPGALIGGARRGWG